MPNIHSSPWIGIDIGGANLKAAHTSGWSKSVPFAMWREAGSLGLAIGSLLEDAPAFCGVAVTMTGELADCFATRAHGVAAILEQVTSILPSSMVRVYALDGTWKTPAQAARDVWSVAASNWHGLARFVARLIPDQNGLLIDIGSTTTDLIPILQGKPYSNCTTDSQRLQAGMLVYTGVERSNLVGVVREVPLYDEVCPVMNEQFATMRDVYQWLGEIPDQPERCDTADNQPAIRRCARYRLARIVGEDGSTLADLDIDRIAQHAFSAQIQMLVEAIQKQTMTLTKAKSSSSKSKPKRALEEKKSASVFDCVVVSGHGHWLAHSVLAQLGWGMRQIDLCEQLGAELSRCAPAYAIAVLASEEH